MENEQQNRIVKTLLYKGTEGAVTGDFIIGDETLWATQKTLSELFKKDKNTISEHLQNIFKTKELNEISTVRKFQVVQKEGNRNVTRNLNFYNLDAMIAVGYRVNSKEGTKFRIWATSILRDYMVKGYVLDKELLKNGTRFGKDYFDKLLDEVKEIRSSERRFYQKITDIYATSYDYNPKAEITLEFFKNVQNKLHYAVSGHTAPEIIAERADINKPYMGLKTWDKYPKGKILQKDVIIAKNYLDKKEIDKLNRIVSMYLDYAENQAIEQRPMSMKDWAIRLDKFLEFNEYKILENKGNVSREYADKIANTEYKKFRLIQDEKYLSDFDDFLKKTKNSIDNK